MTRRIDITTPQDIEAMREAVATAQMFDQKEQARKRRLGELLLETRSHFTERSRWRAWLKRHFETPGERGLSESAATEYMEIAALALAQEKRAATTGANGHAPRTPVR
jgi:hypothetical protein